MPGCCNCGGGTTPIVVPTPGCFCTSAPPSLSCTVTYGPGEDVHTYGGGYIDSAMQYYTFVGSDKPSYAIHYSGGLGPGHYSVSPWIDDIGFYNFYKLLCFSSQYSIGLGQYFPGFSAVSPGAVYDWAMGSKSPVNFCSPFGLMVGQKATGTFFNGAFIITG